MFVFKSCPSYRESNKWTKKEREPTLKRTAFFDVLFAVAVASRCLRSLTTKERQGRTVGVRLTESQRKGVKKERDQLWVSVIGNRDLTIQRRDGGENVA